MTSRNTLLLATIAQTNLALYRQMYDADYKAEAIAHIRDCYEFASTLFTGHLRATGKPFLAHLVGTASVLVSLRAAPDIVAAGLLHAAYEQGDFGLTRWRNRRAKVLQAIGSGAESLVWQYQHLPWTRQTIDDVRKRLGELSDDERAVVLMRLANELDDNLDLAMNYCHTDKDAYSAYRDVFVEMAERLAQPELAAALDRSYRDADDGKWATPLSLNRRSSYQIASPFGLTLLKLVRRVINAVGL
jgi:(p)ppGpp synthase/HD superfamily hydrolase